jgi:hypothetical protein
MLWGAVGGQTKPLLQRVRTANYPPFRRNGQPVPTIIQPLIICHTETVPAPSAHNYHKPQRRIPTLRDKALDLPHAQHSHTPIVASITGMVEPAVHQVTTGAA